MKLAISIMLFLGINFLSGQKMVSKSLLATNTSFIHVNTENCFEVNVETWDSQDIKLEASMEGEYNPDLVLNLNKEGTTVTVSTGFQPNFVLPDDKLSAHKIISVKLRIKVPKHKNVQLYGTSTNCFITGVFNSLRVTLDDGSCSLNMITADAEVTTQSGQIVVLNSKALVAAVSKYGKVWGELSSSNANYFNLATVTGNIHLNKTE